MAFWLARKRKGQDFDYIQRFDPRFWTVDFPRPAMASVVTTGPASLRVEVEFHTRDSLAGLIWESEDRWDHPLLAYDTDRDYSRTTLSFHWRSGGIVALDAVHGPTLTIEGEDANGQQRSWYVRLWNYASGAPTEAGIVLPFSALAGGWDVATAPDPVEPARIDRMFISLVPPGFDANDDSLLPDRVNGWVELNDIRCEGDRPLLTVGDVMVPPHGLRMATAYDDAYNQTPARLLLNIRGLGYRDEVLHYVGMSHYFRLAPDGGGALVAQNPASLCIPAQAWHESYASLCAAQGFDAIFSLSFELLAQHCPADWFQRAYDGGPALTGWDPPSTLLAIANAAARDYLRDTALHFTGLQAAAGLPVKFQIGEPWWWVGPDFAPCIYDDSARAAFSHAAPEIADMRGPLTSAQRDVLAAGGVQLGQATDAIRDAVVASHPAAEVYVLAFTPTLLRPDMADMPTLNLPDAWQSPAFDRLQLEDYDWLTGGAEALRKQGYAAMQGTLQYPLSRQDYLAGFVLDGADADAMWPLIDAGIDEAIARGTARQFVWALPQVCRDGYTRLAPRGEDDDMQAFDDVLYPLALGRDASASPEFSTTIAVTASGHERRNSHWSDARLRFDVGPGIRSEAELAVLIAFFRARRGAARGFRLADPFDFSSHAMTGTPTMLDQAIGTGDGLTATFQLAKRYGDEADPQVRPITRPRAATVTVSIDGVAAGAWTLGEGGLITFAEAPASGAAIRAGFLFDVPVRFAEDRLDVSGAAFAAGEAPSVPLIEIREA